MRSAGVLRAAKIPEFHLRLPGFFIRLMPRAEDCGAATQTTRHASSQSAVSYSRPLARRVRLFGANPLQGSVREGRQRVHHGGAARWVL